MDGTVAPGAPWRSRFSRGDRPAEDRRLSSDARRGVAPRPLVDMLARLSRPPGQRVRAPARMGETFDRCSLSCRSEAARTPPGSAQWRRRPVVLSVIVTAFILVLPVELPDKTLFASLVLATRYPHWPVFVGVGTAFGLQVVIAVTAGSLLSLLPEALVSGVVAVLFLVGAIILWRSANEGPEDGGEAADARERTSFLRAATIS